MNVTPFRERGIGEHVATVEDGGVSAEVIVTHGELAASGALCRTVEELVRRCITRACDYVRSRLLPVPVPGDHMSIPTVEPCESYDDILDARYDTQ